MASVHSLKPAFQALLRPVAVRLAALGVTANQVTVAAALLSVAWGAVIVLSGGAAAALLGLPLVLLIRMALNAIDGMLAREHGQESRPGFFLNELGDVASDAALYLPLMLVLAPGAAILAGATVTTMALAEMAGVLGCAGGGSRRYDGPFGKSDRAVYFSILAVAAALLPMPADAAVVAIAAALALSLATTANRVAASRSEARDG